MKRSYFIFCGSAMACCISMLFALQIGNFSMTSSVVDKTAVSLCSSDGTVIFENSRAYNDLSPEMYTACKSVRHEILNDNTLETYRTQCIDYAQVGNGSNHDLTALISSQSHTGQRVARLLYGNSEIEQHYSAHTYSVDDSEIQEGFYSIIDFPDKLS